jgi:bifunctional non-homologous end joining protein LigD
MTYDLRPMLATPSNGTRSRRGIEMSTLVGTHAFDEKIDGVRMLAVIENGTVRLVNRNGVDRTAQYPEIDPRDMIDCVLDGEIVAIDCNTTGERSFEATAIRDKQARPSPQHLLTYPAMFIAFDVLYVDGHDVRSMPWHQRRTLMENLLYSSDAVSAGRGKFAQSMCVRPPWASEKFYDDLVADGAEGIIAKDVNARYRPGRQPTWVKFKHTQSITCVAVGYEPGQGARKHFGAMRLALVGPSGPVEVGRVGTGFTDSEITTLKSMLDAGTPFPVEIECLNVTKSGQLRFPVYKGIRGDLTVIDCTLDQLDTIPTC